MHIVLLKFGPKKSAAPQFMQMHNEWIAKGFSDGVFQCVGSLEVGGGAIIASGEEGEALRARVERDPFVEHGVVTAEVHKVVVNRTTPELAHLGLET